MSVGLQITELGLTSALTAPSGYFRSKLFSSHAASNPMVAAASPLLSLLERISICQNLPAIGALRDNIEHELFAFYSRLHGQQFPEEIIALGHYLLSATIDEFLGKNYLRLNFEATAFKAFTPPSASGLSPETQFFVILGHLQEHVHRYLDVLELGYYCLSIGFEGEHHVKTDGRQILDNLIDAIHKTIQQHRIHKTQNLFQSYQDAPAKEVIRYKSLLPVLLIASGMIITSYLGGEQLINRQAQTVFKHYTADKSLA